MSWFFERRAPIQSSFSIVWWWELRRVPYNVIVAVFGLFCLSIYVIAITYVLEPALPTCLSRSH